MHQDISSVRLMGRLTSLFPSEFLEEYAEELGVIERDRKLQIPAFVWALNVLKSRTREYMIVPCSTPDRGCKDGSYSSIWRISSTAGLR